MNYIIIRRQEYLIEGSQSFVTVEIVLRLSISKVREREKIL